MPGHVSWRVDKPQTGKDLVISADDLVVELRMVPVVGKAAPGVRLRVLQVFLLHEDGPIREEPMASAVVEIQVRRNDKIDVLTRKTKVGQAARDQIARLELNCHLASWCPGLRVLEMNGRKSRVNEDARPPLDEVGSNWCGVPSSALRLHGHICRNVDRCRTNVQEVQPPHLGLGHASSSLAVTSKESTS